MTSNCNESNNNDSYHLKQISFEDSQVDHFIPFSSPSILYWQTNKKSFYSHDISDIEKKRGNSSNQDLSTSNLIQFPAENTFEISLTKPQNKIIKSNKSIENLELNNDSKLIPQSSKIDSKNMDLSSYRDKSNLIELNKSKTLSDLENNIQKRLNFLDLSEKSLRLDNEAEEIINRIKLKAPTIKLNDLTQDDTAEVLLELSGEDEDQEDEEENKENESSYLKLIDQKLNEKKLKKLESITSEKNNKNLLNFKKKNFNSVTWEISPKSSTQNESPNISSRKSEISTQTSFIQPMCESKQNRAKFDNNVKKSPLNQLKFDPIQQKKFKQMIEAQKHEKRYKELELLAKLERLQAERLKKLILESDSDTSSVMCDSYFNPSNSYLDNEGSLDTERLEKAINELKLNNKNNRRKSEFIRPTSSSSSSNSNDFLKPRNLNDLSLMSDFNSTLNSKSTRLSFNNINKTPVEVLNLKNTTIIQKPKGVLVVKENELNKKDIKSVKSEPMFFKLNTEGQKMTSSFNKMSLQEAFSIFKQDLIKRSEKRLKEIEKRSKLRNEQAEFDRKQAQINLKLKETESRLIKSSTKQQFLLKRKMSAQEIKDLTKKNYEKLPEVKQKQNKERLERTKKLNIIKSSIYKKTIQQHVLSKGPNFSLNYKALKN